MSKTQQNTPHKKKSGKRTTSDALEIMDNMMGDDAEMKRLVEEAEVSATVGELIYNARQAAGLTQTELAEMVATTQSTISDLEDADYEGHSLTMLRRIGDALGKKIEIRFVDAGDSHAA